MSDYTEDKIALMAKLVPEHVTHKRIPAIGVQHCYDDVYVWINTEGAQWQPWSDWRDLGPLYLACYGWWANYENESVEDLEKWFPLIEATQTSHFPDFAAAVCNLAIEIGKTL